MEPWHAVYTIIVNYCYAERSEWQPADEKRLRAVLRVVKTGYNPPTLAALAQNNDNTNDDIETRDRN